MTRLGSIYAAVINEIPAPCGILWKGVVEPLTHVCTNLKISKESNVLIQVIVM